MIKYFLVRMMRTAWMILLISQYIFYSSLLSIGVRARGVDIYPWGNYDFQEYSEDLLQMLRANAGLDVLESTLVGSPLLPPLVKSIAAEGTSTAADAGKNIAKEAAEESIAREEFPSMFVKNAVGSTYEVRLRPQLLMDSSSKEAQQQLLNSELYNVQRLHTSLVGKCAVLTAGYWNYEWCHRNEIRQFHVHQRGKRVTKSPDWSMGKYVRSIVVRKNGDFANASVPIVKLVDFFEGGQQCDENGQFRATEVHIQCCEGTKLSNYIPTDEYRRGSHSTNNPLPPVTLNALGEPSLCSYHATVCTPLLCKSLYYDEHDEAGLDSVWNDDEGLISDEELMQAHGVMSHEPEQLNAASTSPGVKSIAAAAGRDIPITDSRKTTTGAGEKKVNREKALRNSQRRKSSSNDDAAGSKNHGHQDRSSSADQWKPPRNPVSLEEADLVALMRTINGSCVHRQDEWWTYEVCFGRGIHQVRYNIEQTVMPDGAIVHKQIVANKFVLGLPPLHVYDNQTALKQSISSSRQGGSFGGVSLSKREEEILETAGMVSPQFRMRGKDPKFLSFNFNGGTPCDLDAIDRSTVLDLYCGQKNQITNVLEDSTCHYHIKVELTILCSLKDFMPYKDKVVRVEFLSFDPQAPDDDSVESNVRISSQGHGESIQAHQPNQEQSINVAHEQHLVEQMYEQANVGHSQDPVASLTARASFREAAGEDDNVASNPSEEKREATLWITEAHWNRIEEKKRDYLQPGVDYAIVSEEEWLNLQQRADDAFTSNAAGEDKDTASVDVLLPEVPLQQTDEQNKPTEETVSSPEILLQQTDDQNEQSEDQSSYIDLQTLQGNEAATEGYSQDHIPQTLSELADEHIQHIRDAHEVDKSIAVDSFVDREQRDDVIKSLTLQNAPNAHSDMSAVRESPQVQENDQYPDETATEHNSNADTVAEVEIAVEREQQDAADQVVEEGAPLHAKL